MPTKALNRSIEEYLRTLYLLISKRVYSSKGAC
jgi:hypothetical protein